MNKVQREFVLSLDRDGEVAPADVLAAAIPEDSPIHGLFLWDDGVAGQRYRLDQARDLIRRVKVNYVPGTKTIRQIRVSEYVHDPLLPQGQQGYSRTTLLRTRQGGALAALAAEIARVSAMVERARMIAAHLGLSAECEVGLQGILGVQRRKRKAS